MKSDTRKRNVLYSNLKTNILILLTFALLSCLSLLLVRLKLLENARVMGSALARTYSAEEQNMLTVYQTLMEMGIQFMDNQTEETYESEAFQQWLDNFFQQTTEVLGDQHVKPYAVINGQLFNIDTPDGNPYDYASADWYQKAMEAKGTIIFTDAYHDGITGRLVLTIAQKSRKSDNVLAFDIFPENFHTSENPLDIPEDSSYYLCDQSGNVLFYKTSYQHSEADIRRFAAALLSRLQHDKLDGIQDYVIDLDGERRGVYFYQLNNGWVAIITIPFHNILGEIQYFYGALISIIAGFFLLILMMFIRDHRHERQMSRIHDTLQVLSNSYSALYRIHYINGTYEAIKSSDYVKQHLAKAGRYEDLLNLLKEIVEETIWQDFADSFSQENIRQLVEKQVRDFGGDFLRRYENGYHWVNVRVLFDDSLAKGEAVLCFREVEQEKKQQLDQLMLMQNALESARKSEAAKNTFFSNMSHDMRTPLNAIIGLSDLAEKNLDARGLADVEKQTDYIRKIRFSSKQLLSLINDVLDMSRIEHGKVSLDWHPINLKECVENCAAIFYEQARTEKKQFTLHFDIQDATVIGDGARIGQILNNLLSNAFKYSREGAAISVWVKQLNYHQYAKYQISVSDTGIGMSEKFIKQIFEPYARETRFGAKNISGTGLGMPIVKSLVQRMSGEITVESQLGKGSTFTIILPLQVVEHQADGAEGKDRRAETAAAIEGTAADGRAEGPEGAGADTRQMEEMTTTSVIAAETASEERTPDTEHTNDSGLAGMRILLAEDNEINMEIAKELLSMYEIEVTEAWNGLEALELFQRSSPFFYDAILMDMQMPEMDGCEAARRIRGLSRTDARNIPIIAVTANAFAEDIAMTTEAGMDAHISKPIDFDALKKTLEMLTGKRQGYAVR